MAKTDLDATKLPPSSLDAQLLALLPAAVRVEMFHFLDGGKSGNIMLNVKHGVVMIIKIENVLNVT